MDAIAVQPAGLRAKADSIAWVAGPVAVGLGIAAHLVTGGPPPAVLILAAITALTCLLAQLTARLNLPGWTLLVVSGVVQQLLHMAFSLFSGSFPGRGFPGHPHADVGRGLAQFGAGSGTVGSGTVGSGTVGSGAVGSGTGADASPESAMHTSELMLHTHLAAAILTVLVVVGVNKLVARRKALRNGG